MLKKSIALAILALSPLTAFADDDVGCGWGTQVWKGQSGLVAKVLASTTNGLLGNQTFGITSGTSGCSQDGVIKAEYRAPAFAAANLDQLAAEMAVGRGESLAALAAIYNVQGADREAFYAMTKAHYSQIFRSEATTASEVIASVQALMKADTRLAQYAS
ncbi:DUF3015 domain-containing protein [Solimonas sp. K1W22B-7]|uniref:DUF3015 domain-containing protein n=1 Tax=Solimonas sp. K1W22B-7 TaxID=2303331 RepID=UPI000E3335E2|nr:DUF3015 domain-containing protein [Solimonas sp. K1W22B-7]AXQ29634.1 DUF3015 domain-containing protein [Solimonas sp. K1W22B-7]